MNKRLAREIQQLILEPDPFIHVSMDLTDCILVGPPSTPFAFGLFPLAITAHDYPFQPPIIKHLVGTRFHPNFYQSGLICVSTLGTYGQSWSPLNTLHTLLISLVSLLTADPLYLEPGYECYADEIYFEAIQHLPMEQGTLYQRASACYNYKLLQTSISTLFLPLNPQIVIPHFFQRFHYFKQMCHEHEWLDGLAFPLMPFETANNCSRGVFQFNFLSRRLDQRRSFYEGQFIQSQWEISDRVGKAYWVDQVPIVFIHGMHPNISQDGVPWYRSQPLASLQEYVADLLACPSQHPLAILNPLALQEE